MAAESVEVEAMEAAAEDMELAVEEMADATEAEEEATTAESTDAEAVAYGMITGDKVTDPVDMDALAGITIEVEYPLTAMGRIGPDGAGSCTELGIPLAMELTSDPGPARMTVVVATLGEGFMVTVAEAPVG